VVGPVAGAVAGEVGVVIAGVPFQCVTRVIRRIKTIRCDPLNVISGFPGQHNKSNSTRPAAQCLSAPHSGDEFQYSDKAFEVSAEPSTQVTDVKRLATVATKEMDQPLFEENRKERATVGTR
jgi:hypothetical protein